MSRWANPIGAGRAAAKWVAERLAETPGLELIVLPPEYEDLLFAAATNENLAPHEYTFKSDKRRQSIGRTYLSGVRVMFSAKVPSGQWWARYRGGNP